MKEINHIYSLKPHWQHSITEGIGARPINDKWLEQPEHIGQGGSYFLEVAPGLSVVVMDLVFDLPVRIRRTKTDEDFYIIHYDFSDEMNLIRIDGEKHKLGYKASLGLGVIDNRIDSVFEPVVGERVFAIRLLVAKKILNFPLPVTQKDQQKALYFYDNIDSKSRIIMHRIKNKSFSDPAYDLYLRGAAFKLLAKFMERYSGLKTTRLISEKEAVALQTTQEYLLQHLQDDFPRLELLSQMAGMSVSKYKNLFRSVYADAPKKFFTRNKMLLAQQLLRSGTYISIQEVVKEVGYDRVHYFSNQYQLYLQKMPADDFWKKD